MMIKFLIRVAAIIILCFLCSICAFADNVSCYGNIDDSNNICNMLTDAMQNDTKYDPFNQYVVLRAGEYDYRCYFGKDLSKSDLVCYRYIPSTYGTPASLSRSLVSSLTIINNGYYYVGNVPGSLASANSENYKVGVVVSLSIVAILFFVIFRFFRKSEGNRVSYYKIRG